MKESTEWPLHLVIQWQMDLQFSARLSGNKEHFHFRQEAASVQSSSIRLFKQLQTLHTSLVWLLQLGGRSVASFPHLRWVLLYRNCLWFYLFTALPILLRTGHKWATSWYVCICLLLLASTASSRCRQCGYVGQRKGLPDRCRGIFPPSEYQSSRVRGSVG